MFKKNNHLILNILLIVFIFSGCSLKNITHDDKKIKNSEIPPPYKLAIEAIENHDMDRAIDMLNLAIQDFPENDYVYQAYILKNAILFSKLRIYSHITSCHIEGAKQSAIFTDEAKKTLSIGEKYLALMENELKELQPTIEYLYNNYTGKQITINLSNYKPKSYYKFYSYMESTRQIGLSEPEEAIERESNNALTAGFFVTLFNYFGDEDPKLTSPLNGDINYPALFLLLGSASSDKLLSSKCFQRVIELTNNDKYNKFRLIAEKNLKIVGEE